ILGDWPNTYTFTKAIAENAVKKYSKNLPLCLIRPSAIFTSRPVIATYKELLRSWIDNLYGPTGIVVGAGTGLLKTLHCDKKKNTEIVPRD
ncbi:NAD binding 4 domain containing protein, partial [Asbolus verrucosus]